MLQYLQIKIQVEAHQAEAVVLGEVVLDQDSLAPVKVVVAVAAHAHKLVEVVVAQFVKDALEIAMPHVQVDAPRNVLEAVAVTIQKEHLPEVEVVVRIVQEARQAVHVDHLTVVQDAKEAFLIDRQGVMVHAQVHVVPHVMVHVAVVVPVVLVVAMDVLADVQLTLLPDMDVEIAQVGANYKLIVEALSIHQIP